MKNPYLFDCDKCSNRCGGVSKGIYIFGNDVTCSEKFEDKIIDLTNDKTDNQAKKTIKDGYPDIEIFDKRGKLICYIEVKAQQRTFMSVKMILPKADLKPSETVALNLSDLKRYFEIYDTTKIPIYILWAVSNRPCILKDKQCLLFFQDLNILRGIYNEYGMARRFRRKTGYGDIINGVHKGVVVNYHFSLNELRDDFMAEFITRQK
jgi:hypothetical protein